MAKPEQPSLFEDPEDKTPTESQFDRDAYVTAAKAANQSRGPYKADPEPLAERREKLAETGGFSGGQADIMTEDYHYHAPDDNPGHSDQRRIDSQMHPALGHGELEVADRQAGPPLGAAEWGGQREGTIEERQQFLERRRQYEQPHRDTSGAEALMGPDDL